jgi:hypothetical protein
MGIAHIKVSAKGVFESQTLTEHLIGTAEFASQFALAFNNPEWGRLLGLWHDIGKFSDEFQVMKKEKNWVKLIIPQQLQYWLKKFIQIFGLQFLIVSQDIMLVYTTILMNREFQVIYQIG